MEHVGGYIWNFLNRFGSQVIYIVTNIILARLLTPDDFGTIGVLSIIFMVATTLTESGLGGALIIQKKLRNIDCDTIFVFNFGISVLLYALIFIFSDSIQLFYGIKDLSKITRILALILVINGVCVVPRTILCYDLRFKELCIISLISAVLSSVISIFLAIFNYGVYALVVFQLFGACVTTILTFIYSKYKPAIRFSSNSFKSLFSFGFYTTITGVLNTVYENLITSLYGKWFNIASAGYLSQAKKLSEASTQSILSTVNNTSFPILSKKRHDILLFKREADLILKTIILLVFPIMFVLGLYSNDIIEIIFGRQWLPASPYLKILVIAGLFMILDTLVSNFIKSLGFVNKLFTLTVLKRSLACILIIVAVCVSKTYILYAYTLGAAFGFLLTSILYSRILKSNSLSSFRDSIKYVFFTIPLFLLMLVSCHYINNLIVSCIVAAIEILCYYFIILKLLDINPLNIIKRK